MKITILAGQSGDELLEWLKDDPVADEVTFESLPGEPGEMGFAEAFQVTLDYLNNNTLSVAGLVASIGAWVDSRLMNRRTEGPGSPPGPDEYSVTLELGDRSFRIASSEEGELHRAVQFILQAEARNDEEDASP